MANYMVKDELAMAWLNLSYVSTGVFSREPKPILCSLSGRINFHTLTALMGPSGAGKTTLLKCINMRNKEGLTVETQIHVNKYTPLRTCFIMQDSTQHLFMGLTVRESLMFASKIKNLNTSLVQYRDSYAQTGRSLLELDCCENGSDVSQTEFEPIDKNGKFDHNRNIDRILSELLLQDCALNSVSACSGGEQKRLSIAQELVSQLKPNLLCIDEPTSGLDSNASEMVIQCLRSLSERHRMSIVTSIHQPNSLLLNMFDQLYVMAKGGHCVFTGRPNTLRSYLSVNGIDCPQDVLPIELLLKISSKFPNKSFKSLLNNNSYGKKTNEYNIENITSEPTNKGNGYDIDRLIQSSYKNFTDIREECQISGRLISSVVNEVNHHFNCFHFYYLLLRGYTCFIRYQWKVSAALALFCIAVSGFLIHLYGTDVGQYDGCLSTNISAQTSLMDTFERAMKLMNPESPINLNLKCQFFIVAFLQFVTMSCTILVFPQEVKVFLSEHHNRWYSSTSYFWSKFITDIPMTVIISYIYAFITYYGTGQLMDTFRFAYYNLITLCGMMCSSSMGYFIGVLFCNNFQIAVTSGVAFYLILILLCGFFVPYNTLNPFLQALSFASYIKLTFESILITIYGLDRCRSPEEQILLKQMDLDDNGILASHAYYFLGNIIMWRLIAMIALIMRANDWNPLKLFQRKPKLNISPKGKGLTLVANYINQ